VTTLFVAISSVLITLGLWGYSVSQIPDLFKLNKQLQTEGYYSAEFEFKMLGFAYWLDHGEYAKATSGVTTLQQKMENRDGFIKVPRFASKEEEMEFYLSLQNPKTGAFMDDSYPYCTYEGPTGNILEHLEELSVATGKPLKLKYPLGFLDKIADPKDLQLYLDDLSHLGWLGSKLPESTFHMVRDLFSYTKENNIVERNGLYRYSPEWKRTLIKWLSDNQDSTTGYWGPRFRSNNNLIKLDLHNTGSIVKGFVDSVGNDIYPEFPLRYRKQMFQTTLKVLAEPEPNMDDQDDWHGWTLRRGKGMMLLSRYLWITATQEEKEQGAQAFENFIRYLFKRYWIEAEGAFRFYPQGGATLDGTGTAIGNLQDLGYLSVNKRNRLWNGYKDKVERVERTGVSSLQRSDFDPLLSANGINSIRLYHTIPGLDTLEHGVWGIVYAGKNPIPDVTEVAPRVKAWADTSMQSMGNWISRQSIVNDFVGYPDASPRLISRELPLDEMNADYAREGKLVAVGFDIFQVPRVIVSFTRNPA